MNHQRPMELIRQPNRWSCNVCAWAMVLGMTLDEMRAAVSPSAAIGPIDDTDLVWWAVEHGYSCTDVSADLDAGEQPTAESEWRLARFCVGRRGIFAVTHPEIPEGLHAIAWDGERVFDPLLGHRALSEYRMHGFIWITRAREQEAVA